MNTCTCLIVLWFTNDSEPITVHDYQPSRAYTTIKECEDYKDKHEGIERAGNGGIRYSYKCLPTGVDPRTR